MLRRSLAGLAAAIEERSAQLGATVRLDIDAALDRSDSIQLERPGLWSSNGKCRMVQALDGWIAVNLARDEDCASVPAWLRADINDDVWSDIETLAARAPASALVDQARLLSMPIARVGEVAGAGRSPVLHRRGAGEGPPRRLRVLDMSALWAGPLCGSVFVQMGAEVLKLECARRPDASRFAAPGHYQRLNSGKNRIEIDLASEPGVDCLRREIAAADVIISSARPRAFAQWRIDPMAVIDAKPSSVWVAVSGYGWVGAQADRVAFGDDAAAAGGLIRWAEAGAPMFLGDAIADPIAGLAAAAAALRALQLGGGFLVDAALAPCAARARAGQLAEAA